MRPYPPIKSANRCRGFTMIEILVVVAMIAVLAVLTVSGARSMLLSSKQAASAGKLGNLGIALHLYAQDHEGDFQKPLTPSSLKVLGFTAFVNS